MAGGAGDGAGPLAVDLDEAHAGGLQPAQDLLGLLGGGGWGRARRRPDRLGGGTQRRDELVGVTTGRDHPGRGQATESDDVHRPSAVVLAAGGDNLGTTGHRRQPLGAGRRPDERGEPVAMDAGLLEAFAGGES